MGLGGLQLALVGACLWLVLPRPAAGGMPLHTHIDDTDKCLARVIACSGGDNSAATVQQGLLQCVSSQGTAEPPHPHAPSQASAERFGGQYGTSPVPSDPSASTTAALEVSPISREIDASPVSDAANTGVLDDQRAAWSRYGSKETDESQHEESRSGEDDEYKAAASRTLIPRKLRAAQSMRQRMYQAKQRQQQQQHHQQQRGRRDESTTETDIITSSTSTTTYAPSPSVELNTQITVPPAVTDSGVGRVTSPKCTLKEVLALTCELPKGSRSIVIVIEPEDSLTSAEPVSSANRLNLTTLQDASTASGWVAPGLQVLASHDPAGLSLRGSYSLAMAEWILSHATWRFNSLTLRGVTDTTLSGDPFAAVSNITSLSLADGAFLTVFPSVLDALPNLNALDLSNNSLSTLHPALFQGNPNLTDINLSSNLLTSLPETLLYPTPRLRELHLANNHLASFPPALLAGLSHLRTLQASDNRLTELPDGLFRDTTRLKQLSLQDNDIFSISSALLQPLTELNHIYLYSNRITTISHDAFAALTSLDTLNIASNALARLPEPLLHNLRSLVELRLSDNGFASLAPRTFEGLSSLSFLWLSGNGLTSLPPMLLSDLSSLLYIDISNNAITSLPPDIFAGAPALGIAYMNTNALQSLPDVLFHYTKDVELIDVRANAITAFPHGFADGLSRLQELHVSNNRLTTLPSQLFRSTERLHSIRADANLITSLPPALLANLTSLLTVSFLNNRLTDLPPDLWHGSRRLVSINFSRNRLTRFSPDLLSTQTRVSLLRLSHNRIAGFRTDTFHGITTSLRVLSCENNEITELQPLLLRDHKSLNTLDLSNNPLRRVAEDLLDSLPNLRTLRLHNTLLTSLPTPFFTGVPILAELDLSYVPHLSGRSGDGSSSGDGYQHHVPEPLLTITGSHLMSLSTFALETLDLTNVALTEDAADALAGRFSLDTLRVGWAGLDDSSRIVPALCRSLRQGARHLFIRFSGITTFTSCTSRGLKSLHLQHSPRLERVAAGGLKQLNVSGCHNLHALQAARVNILDISDTNLPFSALLCSTLGTRMLFARNLRHSSYSDAALVQRLIETCLEQVQVVDVSQNAWLNNLDLIARVGSQRILLLDSGSPQGPAVSSFWAEDGQRLRQRQTAPVLTLDGSPVQCRFELISLLARRGAVAPLTTEVGYTFRCGCAPRFRRQGEQCAPDSISAAELAGIVVGAVIFGLALGPCAYVTYRARKRSRVYRAKLETENELQKRLIEEKDEEVLALKRAWEIGFDELRFISRIDAGSPGTFGEVWRADWDTVQVAVKVLRQGIMLMDESTVSEFGNEVEFLQRTRHPHVVRFFGAGTTPYGAPFLVLELVAFGSLQALLRKDVGEVLRNAPAATAALLSPEANAGSVDGDSSGALKRTQPETEEATAGNARQYDEQGVWRLKVRLVRDVACGMAFIHSLGKLHRDLKSGNVLVSASLRAKITDFGSIKQCFLPKQQQQPGQRTIESDIASTSFDTGESQSPTGSSSVASAASMSMTAGVGTPLYMAPEALDGNCYDAAADVFSFSVVMWEVATQQQPDLVQQECGGSFRGPLLQALHGLYQSGKRLSFLTRADNVPSWFQRLCCRCWHLHPTDRPSFEEILNAIDEKAKE